MRTSTFRCSNHRRQWAAWLYSLATRRPRRRLRQHFIQSAKVPVAILFYHRVADTHQTPWTISRRNFVQHLDWLEASFDIVTLDEAQRRIRCAHNVRPTVAITFDDGYSENNEFAIPELVRRKLPATYFVATDAVATGQPFAHDIRNGCPLRPNTIAEIQAIAEAGFAIGGHSRSHADFGQLVDREEIACELLGGIEQLESWNVGPINYFSFPFGMPENTTQAAVDLMYEAGLAGFCTAYGAWNWPASAGFHLRRIHADPGMQTLKNWLTFDPRKLTDQHLLPFDEPAWSAYQETAHSIQELSPV